MNSEIGPKFLVLLYAVIDGAMIYAAVARGCV